MSNLFNIVLRAHPKISDLLKVDSQLKHFRNEIVGFRIGTNKHHSLKITR